MRRIRGLLGSPYPFEPSLPSLLLYALGSGLFVSLFFFAVEPFGFSLLPLAPRRALYVGYGLVTFLAIAANGMLVPRLLPRLFREQDWTLGRQILWMGWVTWTIGLGACWLSGAVCAHYAIPAGWVRPRTIVLDTFIVAIFPITVINLANSARLLRRNARVSAEANRRLEKSGGPPQGAAGGERLRITAENEKDSLDVALADLLYIQAEENYVRVHVRGAKTPPPLLRSSLTRVERRLRSCHPPLFRCHRAFIVHTAQIANVTGNAQGLKLALKDAPAVIPVARRYVAEFRRLIREM